MRDIDFSVKEKVLTGGGEACIQGVGSILIRPNRAIKTGRGIIVRNVSYIPEYPINLLSARLLQQINLHFSVRQQGLKNRDGKLLFSTPDTHRQYILEYNPIEEDISKALFNNT